MSRSCSGSLVYVLTNVSQTGTNAPTGTVARNDFEETLALARSGQGTYTITSPGSKFTANKTRITFNRGNIDAGRTHEVLTSTSVCEFHTVNATSNLHEDDLIAGGTIKIEVFL